MLFTFVPLNERFLKHTLFYLHQNPPIHQRPLYNRVHAYTHNTLFLNWFYPVMKTGQVYLTYFQDGVKHQLKVNNIRVYNGLYTKNS